jgi:hypothetical protein
LDDGLRGVKRGLIFFQRPIAEVLTRPWRSSVLIPTVDGLRALAGGLRPPPGLTPPAPRRAVTRVGAFGKPVPHRREGGRTEEAILAHASWRRPADPGGRGAPGPSKSPDGRLGEPAGAGEGDGDQRRGPAPCDRANRFATC